MSKQSKFGEIYLQVSGGIISFLQRFEASNIPNKILLRNKFLFQRHSSQCKTIRKKRGRKIYKLLTFDDTED